MTQARRWKLSAEQKAELWKRWKAGESLHGIGRALGKEHHVIHLLLARHGGIAPAARRRGQRALTLAEREDISRGIACGGSIRGIAKGLKRAVSTVSREVARHGGRPLCSPSIQPASDLWRSHESIHRKRCPERYLPVRPKSAHAGHGDAPLERCPRDAPTANGSRDVPCPALGQSHARTLPPSSASTAQLSALLKASTVSLAS